MSKTQVFAVDLPGVPRWRRVRLAQGRMRYPQAYVRDRLAAALLVHQAVAAQGWVPLTGSVSVSLVVRAAGRLDLDRAVSAVLDALQGGGAILDDCRVDFIHAERMRVPPRPPEGQLTSVALWSV